MINQDVHFDPQKRTVSNPEMLRILPARLCSVIADKYMILFEGDIIQLTGDKRGKFRVVKKIDPDGIVTVTGFTSCLCSNCLRSFNFYRESQNIILHRPELH